MTRYSCCDTFRRNAVAASSANGIDYLEVLDLEAPSGSPRQRTLMVRLLKPVPALSIDNVRIDGGERVRNIRAEWVSAADDPPLALTSADERTYFSALPQPDHVLLVRTTEYGDYSPYVLRLQRSDLDPRPPANFDPRLASVEFSFKVECPSEFDCKPQHECPVPAPPPLDINYLAKDYASFRRLILDRITQLVPAWRERSSADLGVMLAELLAYTGDHLSYWQDAVATEAYLNTARLRTSLRRHSVLVDYPIHEGSNARTLVQLVLTPGVPQAVIDLAGMQFLSTVPGANPRIAPSSPEYRKALATTPVVFEPLDPRGLLTPNTTSQVTLYLAHHEMQFYSWGDRRCCLPKGTTRATLLGHLDTLSTGQLLVFEEVKGPRTDVPRDADPLHRHAVRLTRVTFDEDGGPLLDPLTSTEITEIEWDTADALPFPLCISAQTDEEHGDRLIEGVSVARGNIVIADHGQSIIGEDVGSVPEPRLRFPIDTSQDRCGRLVPEPLPARFRPGLQQRPLTRAATVSKTVHTSGRNETMQLRFDPDAPASRAFLWRDADVLPTIRLDGELDAGAGIVQEEWLARRDLLDSSSDMPHFVVEAEHDGSVWLRFGNDHNGKRPEPTTRFEASYRIGNGLAGIVGPGALAHVVTDDVRVASASNLLPSKGGTEAESADQIRRRAPQAFRTQQRAVTPEDYANVTEQFPGVQRAAATPRWTGSWHTMFITVDQIGGRLMDAAFESALVRHVEPFRMAGHDLEFNDPVYVSLELDITVCVADGYFRSAVREALLRVLSNRDLPGGTKGLFHPDLLSFGQKVFLSPIYAAARKVPGVESLEVTRFQRQGQDETRFLKAGRMDLNRLEIPRLDNDPNFPEHGILRLTLHGGK